MSVTIAGKEFGVLTTGFKRPTKAQILEQKRLDAIAQFGPHVDLSAASPLGRWLAAEAEREDALWRTLEDLYYAGYIPTGTGDALSLKAAEMGIMRRSAAYATGVVTFFGAAGASIPAGTQLQATNGALFQTVEAATMPARGYADVAIRAVEAGAAGNVAAGTITAIVNPVSDVDSVINAYDPGTTLLLGQNDHGTVMLTADGLKNDYQLVRVEDIRHPHNLDEIVVTVRNDVEPTPYSALFMFHIEVVDHLTGRVIGRTETQTFTLDAGAETTLRFTDQGIDIHAAMGDYIRFVFVNEETSEAALGLVYDGGNQYQRGAFYLDTVEQTGYDIVMSLVSRLEGRTTGGTDGETDVELRYRYLMTAATFGSATAEAIRSQVYRVEGVKSVTVRQNRMDYSVDGMNPHSVEVTVYGGDPDEIGQALLASVPAGCETLGTSAVTVQDSVGQTHVFRFNKAKRVPIYVSIDLTVDGTFSYDAGLTQIRDALIAYIGGEDSAGTFRIGLLPGADVIYSKLVAAAIAINGVVDAAITVGKTASPSGMTNITIAADEVAETKAEYINITVV